VKRQLKINKKRKTSSPVGGLFFYGAKISNESKHLLIFLAMATNKKNK
jgi:methylglyoxal synthase